MNVAETIDLEAQVAIVTDAIGFVTRTDTSTTNHHRRNPMISNSGDTLTVHLNGLDGPAVEIPARIVIEFQAAANGYTKAMEHLAGSLHALRDDFAGVTWEKFSTWDDYDQKESLSLTGEADLETIARLASLPYWRKMLDKPDGVPVAAFVSLTDSDTGKRIHVSVYLPFDERAANPAVTPEKVAEFLARPGVNL